MRQNAAGDRAMFVRRAWSAARPARGRLVASAMIGSLASPAFAPPWDEGCVDAGPLPFDAEVTKGTGQLTQIVGALEGFDGGEGMLQAGDFQDMYLIQIPFPSAFGSFATVRDPDLFLRTSLFLLERDGRGVVGFRGSQEIPDARLRGRPSDGSPGLTEPGLYLLAISGTPGVPQSFPPNDPDTPADIFRFEEINEESGPDGRGGPFPIELWSGEGDTGPYVIELVGVRFAQRPDCPADFNADGVLDIFDILLFFELFAAGDRDADLAPPRGGFDVFDIIRYFTLFSAGC